MKAKIVTVRYREKIHYIVKYKSGFFSGWKTIKDNIYGGYYPKYEPDIRFNAAKQAAESAEHILGSRIEWVRQELPS
jgi:hypothetical protein